MHKNKFCNSRLHFGTNSYLRKLVSEGVNTISDGLLKQYKGIHKQSQPAVINSSSWLEQVSDSFDLNFFFLILQGFYEFVTSSNPVFLKK